MSDAKYSPLGKLSAIQQMQVSIETTPYLYFIFIHESENPKIYEI